MAPLFILELKIYGQWLSGGDRRLSKVANPSTHLSVVGNFVGALVGAKVGWTEAAIFFWAVGLAHYIVLFVTLYQRLPSNLVLPKDLHPVFFLFVAAPSAASVAWMKITGSFDLVSRLVFFIALFLYSSLVVRINFFRGIRSDPQLLMIPTLVSMQSALAIFSLSFTSSQISFLDSLLKSSWCFPVVRRTHLFCENLNTPSVGKVACIFSVACSESFLNNGSDCVESCQLSEFFSNPPLQHSSCF
jgi:tellurite resistance protein TehA-like permease